MVRREVTITNKLGLHARPAGIFAKQCSTYPCQVLIVKDGKEYAAKSILSVLAACIKHGAQIELVCDGEGEEEALQELIALIECGLPD